jgi:Flp pilus assembly protein TadG
MKLKHQNGAAAVEFALVAPILLLILFGIMQFAWLMNNYVILTNAAIDGARLFASERGYTTPYTDTRNKVIATAATLKNALNIITVVGTTPCSSDALCILALGSVSTPPTAGTNVSVTLTYTFTPLINVPLFGLGKMMPSTLTATMSSPEQ